VIFKFIGELTPTILLKKFIKLLFFQDFGSFAFFELNHRNYSRRLSLASNFVSKSTVIGAYKSCVHPKRVEQGPN